MQNKASGTNFLSDLKQMGQAPYTLAAGIFRLACLEMQLAKKNLLEIGYLFFLLMIVSLTLWLGINVLAVIYLLSFGFFLISALLIVIAFNILLGVILAMLLIKCSRVITFSATREQLASLRQDNN